jgi:vitamin K-dependent gamma-carboxylase
VREIGENTGISAFQNLLLWMHKPIDASSMAVFRFMYGSIMVWEVTRYFDHNWIRSYYTGKDFYFTYPGFSWVHPWPSLELMEWHFIIMGVFAAMVAVGLFYRTAAVCLAVMFSYVYLLEQARYLNHFYFVILVAISMIFIPANRVWSLDAWIKNRVRGLGVGGRMMPQWGLWAIRAQFGITYFYGGIAKLNEDWLRGYPLSDWIFDDSSMFLIGPYVHERWMGLSLSYAGLMLDLLLVPLLLWRKTRWIGMAFALAFNLMNDHMFSIGIFPWFMIAGTLTFFESDYPRVILDFWTKTKEQRIQLPARRSSPVANVGGLNFTTPNNLLAAFMVVFFVFQFLFPFRHLAYPGNVSWTEEGHMYSWHMKLRSKSGRARFVIKDPDSGREFQINPDDYLNSRQERKMSTRPDMILQFAHWLRDNYREQGMTNVEVYALVTASLNGRKSQDLINPTVDLAKEEWSILPASWIVPLHTERK